MSQKNEHTNTRYIIIFFPLTKRKRKLQTTNKITMESKIVVTKESTNASTTKERLQPRYFSWFVF